MIARPVSCPIFVGRREEFAVLNDARRALAQSQGSVVLVGGEPGIGKSRLLAQFLRHAGDGRVRNLAPAECLERAQQPFGPVRDWVCALLAAVPRADLAPAILGPLAHLVPELAPPGAAPLVGAFEKADLFAALAAFFKLAAARRATILTLEDLQWADPSTLEFLAFLAPRLAGTRILVIATFRSDEVDANENLRNALARMLREPTVRQLELRALPAADLQTLIHAALDGHGALPAQTRDDVETRCEGNPFFAEELLKSALEHGDARNAAALPLSIRTGILERLSSLSEDEHRVIDRAAVLGYRFDPRILALTLNCDVDAVLPALRRARSLNIIAEENAAQVRFRFRHALTRQTIYDDMLMFDARRLHEQILQTLESLDEPERHYEELAYHAWAARDPAKTLLYNEKAGEDALGVRALAEARACFERALSVAKDTGDEARLLARLASVQGLQGRLPEALQSYESALALYLDASDYDAAAEMVRAIVTERNNLADVRALDLGNSFLAEHGERLASSPRDMLLALMARVACGVYDFEAVSRYLARVSDPAALPPRARQNYLIARMEIHGYAGEVAAWNEVARALYDATLELAPYLAAIALYTLAQSGMYLGANELVERALVRAAKLEADWDFSAVAAFGASIRAGYWHLRGRLDLAHANLERALERGDLPVVFYSSAVVAPLVALALDDAALAARSLDEAGVRIARIDSSSPDDAAILGARAAWMAEHSRLAEARVELRMALRPMPRAVPVCAIALLQAARHLTLPELPQIEKLIEPGLARDEDRAARAVAAIVGATVAERREDVALMTGRATLAVDLFHQLGWPLYEAHALELLGRFTEARAIYESCGATFDVRRLAQRTAGDTAPAAAQLLSTRERAVAELITAGLTNAAIAERLGVSWKTVEKHVSSIFTKLGVRSRAQVAALLVRNRAGVEPEIPLGAAR